MALGIQIAVNLWTIHPPDFLLTVGRVDHSKSEYYRNTPGVREAYPKLWDRLNVHDGQLVWCDTHEEDIPATGIEKTKSTLCVPGPSVLCLMDDLVWNRILGKTCAVRSDMICSWRKEALKKHPSDPKASRAYEQQCFEAYWNQQPKGSSWWDELFVNSPGEAVSAIITHPVPCEWVVQKTLLCTGQSRRRLRR